MISAGFGTSAIFGNSPQYHYVIGSPLSQDIVPSFRNRLTMMTDSLRRSWVIPSCLDL